MKKLAGFALLGCLVLSGGECPAQPFLNSSFMVVNGVSLHYRLWEPSEDPAGTLFFVHGMGGSTFSWRLLVEPLAEKGYRCVAIDLPGFGYSQRGHELDYSYSGQAKLLWAFYDALALEDQICLVGHSLGGCIVLHMATLRNCWGAVLIAPALDLKAGHLELILSSAPVRWVLSPFLQTFFITENRIKKILTVAYGRTPEHDEIMGYLQPLGIKGTVASLLARSNRKEENCLATVPLNLPVISLWGAEDAWVGITSTERVLQLLPASSAVVIEDGFHLIMETHSRFVLQTIIGFLGRLDNDSH